MLQGTLLQQQDKWTVVFPAFDDFTTSENEMPTHPEHNLWLKVWGEDGMNVSFKIKGKYAEIISILS
jgi:hypothetical protein